MRSFGCFVVRVFAANLLIDLDAPEACDCDTVRLRLHALMTQSLICPRPSFQRRFKPSFALDVTIVDAIDAHMRLET